MKPGQLRIRLSRLALTLAIGAPQAVLAAQADASCHAALVGIFKVVEKRSASGVSEGDGDLVKISREGASYVAQFFESDGRQLLDEDGKDGTVQLSIIARDRLHRWAAGKEDHPNAIPLEMCGLAGGGMVILRTTSKETAEYTLAAGSGFGSAIATLKKIK